MQVLFVQLVELAIGSLIAPGAGTWAGGILGSQWCTGAWAIATSV
ncbi:hypothetical protein STRMA_1365 [Streptococcus macacae NCTC 11558]|uniref:Uncharacterized protein n=1 Tax=Streptococcus macacae NCTC 11558 TaxID=764298 RepID=G5JUY0_9STRE|nr:hypothetical protein STRMA_1365 [Streptococcus macacae NCTC 11558]